MTAPKGHAGKPDREEATITVEAHHPPFDQRQLAEFLNLFQRGLDQAIAGHNDSTCQIAVRAGDDLGVDLSVRKGDNRGSIRSSTLLDPILHNIETGPGELAAIEGDRRVTYAELSSQAAAVSAALADLGCGRGDVVGIWAGAGIDSLAAILGTWFTDAAFVVLDPEWPTDRVKQVVQDCQPCVILSGRHRSADRADELPDVRVVELGSCFDTRVATALPSRTAGPDDLAYIMYTSGSTGQPKGVLIPHRGIANYILWSLDSYRYAKSALTPVQSAISADLIFPSLFGPLVSGGAIDFVKHRHGGVMGMAATLEAGAEYAMIKATPSQLDLVSSFLEEDSSIRVHTMVVGAEACSAETARKIFAMVPSSSPILNEYGPTETVVGCSTYPMDAGIEESSILPIGLPIANMQMYVLNNQLDVLRPGCPGELGIGGEGVAWGYHRRARKTAARFIPDPFSDEPGARMYRSGDLAAYSIDPVRNIEFLGRIDSQLKIMGYRVEPGEIEQALRDAPGVRDVCVEANGSGEIIAHCAIDTPDIDFNLRAIDELATATLPRYMVPAAYTTGQSLPLTPAGKVDYASLGKRVPIRVSGADMIPNRDEAGPGEAALAAVREQVESEWYRAVGPVDPEMDFFDAGGDSLRLTVLLEALETRFGANVLSLQDFFKQPTMAATVQAVAAFLASSQRGVYVN